MVIIDKSLLIVLTKFSIGNNSYVISWESLLLVLTKHWVDDIKCKMGVTYLVVYDLESTNIPWIGCYFY